MLSFQKNNFPPRSIDIFEFIYPFSKTNENNKEVAELLQLTFQKCDTLCKTSYKHFSTLTLYVDTAFRESAGRIGYFWSWVHEFGIDKLVSITLTSNYIKNNTFYDKIEYYKYLLECDYYDDETTAAAIVDIINGIIELSKE